MEAPSTTRSKTASSCGCATHIMSRTSRAARPPPSAPAPDDRNGHNTTMPGPWVIGSFWKRKRPEQRPEVAQHEERPCDVSERPEPKRRRRPKSTLGSEPANASAGAGSRRSWRRRRILQKLAHTYLGPDARFPPVDNPPPGLITHISVDPDSGVGPWAPPHRYNKVTSRRRRAPRYVRRKPQRRRSGLATITATCALPQISAGYKL